MTLPTLETIASYLTIFAAVTGALFAALWLSIVIWTFRDMRLRSRDPFAQILAAVVVALLPIVGIIIYLILRPPETLAEAYERALEEEALLQEIEERPHCPGCSRVVEAGWILCPHCHTRLRKRCPDCDELQELHWNLCPYCGNNHVDLYRVEPPVGLPETIGGDNRIQAAGGERQIVSDNRQAVGVEAESPTVLPAVMLAEESVAEEVVYGEEETSNVRKESFFSRLINPRKPEPDPYEDLDEI